MIEKSHALEHIMDKMSRGLIYIDADKTVQIFNQKAKQIVGTILLGNATHDAGYIDEGDIVILADNKLGEDDGSISPEDLASININDKDIRAEDMLLGIGVYKNTRMEPVYKHLREVQPGATIKLEANYLGFNIEASISTRERIMHISVNGNDFPMPYFNSVGHLVVIDHTNGGIKFFQAKGYSTRKESLGELLRGAHFMAKINRPEGYVEFSVEGSNLFDLVEGTQFQQKIASLLEGKEDSVKNTLYEINKRWILCSMYSEMEAASGNAADKVTGVYIVIEDAAELEELLDDRNRIIEDIEKKYNENLEWQKELPKDAFSGFAGIGPTAREVKYLAYKASQTKFNVIITGESGTGKSKIAKEIHNLKNPKAPFVEVNCNAIAPTLFESELFGYVGGAFTGAMSSGKTGYFEAANGGTIFLDEIGEIPMEIQVKLLQVLQNKIIYPVGSSKPVNVDVRVIAATNKNLADEVRKGTFRQDLFYRINVFPIEIPPLRERKEDLYILINQLMQDICRRYELEPKQFSGGALRKLLSYDWPGNVRELENSIERAITLCSTSLIYPEHINIGSSEASKTLKELLAAEEANIIKSVLLRNNGNKQASIMELDMSKSVFYDKLRKYGIK